MTASDLLNRYWDGLLPVEPRKLYRAMDVPVADMQDCSDPQVRVIRGARNDRITVGQFRDSKIERFALAHALGHLSGRHGGKSETITCCRASFRANHQGMREIQANLFALDLLIPERILKYAITQQNLTDVGELAGLFGVSEVAMAMQLKRRLSM